MDLKFDQKSLLVVVFALMTMLTLSFMSSTFFLRSQINQQASDRFRRADMNAWLADFRAKNTSLVVPELGR